MSNTARNALAFMTAYKAAKNLDKDPLKVSPFAAIRNMLLWFAAFLIPISNLPQALMTNVRWPEALWPVGGWFYDQATGIVFTFICLVWLHGLGMSIGPVRRLTYRIRFIPTGPFIQKALPIRGDILRAKDRQMLRRLRSIVVPALVPVGHEFSANIISGGLKFTHYTFDFFAPGTSIRKAEAALDQVRMASGFEFGTVEEIYCDGIALLRFSLMRELPPSILDNSADFVAASAESHGANLSTGIPCGLMEDGTPLLAQFRNNSGSVIGGVPGAGKTVGATTIATQLAANPAVQFVVFDGKGGTDWDWIAPRASIWNNDDEDLATVDAQLEQLRQLMRYRARTLKAARGDSNIWNTGGPGEDFPLIIVIIDECQTYYDKGEWSGDKGQVAYTVSIAGKVTSLVKKGRSLGFMVMNITQKPTVDSIPSGLRDNSSVKWACRLTTRAATEAVLGDMPDEVAPSALPTQIPDTRPAGVTVNTGGTWKSGRFTYTPERIAEAAAAANAHLRIPFESLTAIPDGVTDNTAEEVTNAA